MSEQWFWCLRHQRVESEDGCRADDRLGPYATREAAAAYAETVERRNEAWEADDRRWDGE